MILSTSTNYNPNYLAHLVLIDKVEPHPNADRLKLVTVYNCVVVAGLGVNVGDEYVYIPVEAEISDKFLRWSNSYDKPEKNSDPNVKGYFSSRRVRMIKLRGVYSNGYIFEFAVFAKFVKEVYGKTITFEAQSFDTVCDELFVNKYEVPVKEVRVPGEKIKGKIHKFNRVIPGQFAFHPDTKNLRFEILELKPDDYISVTKKYHGSCFEVANTLVYRELKWYEKLLFKLGIHIPDKEYGRLYASRTIIKDAKTNPNAGPGFYGVDIWAVVADRAFHKLDKGIRITGEIIGYTPTGKMIQKGYDYGVTPNELDFLVFKVDIVNADGDTITMSHPQMVEYCAKKGFRVPECYYYGKAKDLFPELDTEQHWHENFLNRMEKTFLCKKELTNIDKTLPEEGVVLNIQRPLGWKALKLKDLEFMGIETKHLDEGEVGVEECTIGDNDC